MTSVTGRQVGPERRLDGTPRGPDPSPELARVDRAVARAEDLDGAGGRPQLEPDRRQQGRLARAVRAEHDPALTGPDRPVERTEDRPPGTPDDETPNLDDGRRLVRIASVGVGPVNCPSAAGEAAGGGGVGVGRRRRRRLRGRLRRRLGRRLGCRLGGVGSSVGGGGSSVGSTDGSDGSVRRSRARGRAGERRCRRARRASAARRTGSRRSGPGVGTGEARSATGLGSPHLPATRTPHDEPYGWKPPVVEVGRPVPVRAAGDARAAFGAAQPVAVGLHPAVEARFDVDGHDDVDAARVRARARPWARSPTMNHSSIAFVVGRCEEPGPRVDLDAHEAVGRPLEVGLGPLGGGLVEEALPDVGRDVDREERRPRGRDEAVVRVAVPDADGQGIGARRCGPPRSAARCSRRR